MAPELWSVDFWLFVGAIATLVNLIQALVRPFIDSIPTQTERCLVEAIAEQFQRWVSVESQSQKMDTSNLRIWLEEKDGVWTLGRSFRVLKKVVKNLNKKGYTDINLIEETDFNQIVRKVDGATRLARNEW